MSYPLLPAMLGTCFVLIWVFIAAMVLRDGQRAVRSEREFQPHFPRPTNRTRPQFNPTLDAKAHS